jgi:hypothetical protein
LPRGACTHKVLMRPIPSASSCFTARGDSVETLLLDWLGRLRLGPQESTSWEDRANGVEVLNRSILRLDQRLEPN